LAWIEAPGTKNSEGRKAVWRGSRTKGRVIRLALPLKSKLDNQSFGLPTRSWPKQRRFLSRLRGGSGDGADRSKEAR
jgi:hypothetical protein